MTTILLVDDEPDLLTVARVSLERIGGFTVATCGSGEAALAKAAASPPDLVLLDVMMPGLDGPSTLARLRANPATASLPIVFMTAKAQARDVERYLSLGALGVIAKPFDPMSLSELVRRLLRRAPSSPAPEEGGPRMSDAPQYCRLEEAP